MSGSGASLSLLRTASHGQGAALLGRTSESSIPDMCKPRHEAFRRGEGLSLILIAAGEIPRCDTTDRHVGFYDPAKIWEAQIERARSVIDWPTNGIATVRPKLGLSSCRHWLIRGISSAMVRCRGLANRCSPHLEPSCVSTNQRTMFENEGDMT